MQKHKHTVETMWQELLEYILTLPNTELSTSYGTPAFKVKGKLMARLWPDFEVMVLLVDFVTVDMLLKSNPAVYFVTDHYKGYPAVLVRLAEADLTETSELLEQSWREHAPARVVAAYDAANS